jgi:acyl transferase domain-containing protein
MGCRLPGDIDSPDLFWKALVEGRDCVTSIPDARWARMAAHLHPDQRPTAPFPAGVIDHRFDHAFFGISADEAAEMDPQQGWILEVAHEALADAGIVPSSLAGSRAGVYVGAASIDQATVNFSPGTRAGVYTASGAGMAILANRLSYVLDVDGPSLTLDTACSSSLTALHYAVRDLRSGDIDTAVVAGTNALINPVITASFVEAGVLSPDGRCKPLDQDADGYVRSEGAVAFILTRAATAAQRGHRVWAHVVGTAVGHGGRSAHLLAPRAERQAAVIGRALTDAGIASVRVGWVQGHITGTKAGDRVEGEAIAYALDRDAPVPVGSAKANLGHLEGASGAVGVMAAALAVHHGQVPPTPHHHTLRSRLEGLVRTPTAVEDWPRHEDDEVEEAGARVAAVSSFGFGGANAHAVLTAAPALAPPPAQDPMSLPETVVLSAHTPTALVTTAGRLAEHAPQGRSVGVVADTALAHGRHHRYRTAVVASDLGGLVQGLRSVQDGAPNPDVVGPALAPAAPPWVVGVYIGHGGHHPTAGQALMRLPAFAQALGEARAAMEQQTGYGVWAPGEPVTSFQDAQHCTFLTQVGLSALLAERGIVPDLVLGHSVGEIAAAHAAGVLPLDAAALVLVQRSSLLSGLAEVGALLAVRASVEQVSGILTAYADRVTIASYSAPLVQVVAGPSEDLDHLQARLTKQGVWCKPVSDAIPAHSAAVDPIVPALREALAGLVPHAPRIPIVSTAHPLQDSEEAGLWGAAYWANQARMPVRFTDAVTTAARTVSSGMPAKGVVFVEIGPKALLVEHIAHALDGAHPAVAATVDPAGFAHAMGELYTLGVTPTGPTGRAHPRLVIPPGWDHSAAHATSADEDQVPTPPRGGVEAHLAAEVARLLHLPNGVDLDASWLDLALESHALLQLTSRLRRVPAWAHVDIQLFLPARPLREVAERLTALLPGTPSTSIGRRPSSPDPGSAPQGGPAPAGRTGPPHIHHCLLWR